VSLGALFRTVPPTVSACRLVATTLDAAGLAESSRRMTATAASPPISVSIHPHPPPRVPDAALRPDSTRPASARSGTTWTRSRPPPPGPPLGQAGSHSPGSPPPAIHTHPLALRPAADSVRAGALELRHRDTTAVSGDDRRQAFGGPPQRSGAVITGSREGAQEAVRSGLLP
jgi:hypothetical protein